MNNLGKKDLTDRRFGKVLIVRRIPNRVANRSRWLCKCDCGKDFEADSDTITKRPIKSCGCTRIPSLGGWQSKAWRGHEEISGCYWNKVKAGAKKRKMNMGITIEQAWNLFLKQNRKCALSGMELCFARDYSKHQREQTASLDRIDSSKGYEIDNIQWVDKELNLMKHSRKQERFIELCTRVANHNKEAANS